MSVLVTKVTMFNSIRPSGSIHWHIWKKNISDTLHFKSKHELEPILHIVWLSVCNQRCWGRHWSPYHFKQWFLSRRTICVYAEEADWRLYATGIQLYGNLNATSASFSITLDRAPFTLAATSDINVLASITNLADVPHTVTLTALIPEEQIPPNPSLVVFESAVLTSSPAPLKYVDFDLRCFINDLWSWALILFLYLTFDRQFLHISVSFSSQTDFHQSQLSPEDFLKRL